MLALLSLTMITLLAGDDTAKADLDKFQGTWTLVAMESGGREVPADQLAGSTATYEGNRMTLKADGAVRRRGLITLDPSQTPRAINTWDLDGPAADRTNPGIYEVDGESLRLAFARPGEDRPTAFTEKGGAARVFRYRRSKP